MKYIIMCGGDYRVWQEPRQLLMVKGERIVERTIRLLNENGITDIAISSDDERFSRFGVPLLKHNNGYKVMVDNRYTGYWCDGFYPMDEPVCYLFGDVVFSPQAIKTIIETETDDIEFFGSMPPFAPGYLKRWAEPFALKVVNNDHLTEAIAELKRLHREGKFRRKPIMWELWQVIKKTPLNKIEKNYTAINDYTVDVDDPHEIDRIRMLEAEIDKADRC